MRHALVVGVVLLLAGCMGGQPSPSASHGPSAAPRPSMDPQARAAAFRQKGATEVPPESVGQVSLQGIQVLDQTNGAVSEADARRWAEAYLRDNAYEFWAWNHLQDQFLLQGGLSPVPRGVFSGDLSTIAAARAAGMRIEVTRLQIRRIVVRPIPDSLKNLYFSYGYVWTPYTLFLDQVGPSDLNWLDAQGRRVANKAHVGAGVARPEMVGGQFVTDPLMGDLWTQDSDWDCADPASRQRFGALCNP